MRYEYTNGSHPDFAALCCQLDESLNRQVGGEEHRKEYIKYNKLDDILDVCIAYLEDRPVGCASFKHYANKTAEVKRVFLQPACRGRGVAAELMKRLEQTAREQGYHKLVLETGKSMTAAVSFYRKIGYRITPNYPPYTHMTDSVCMEKSL